MTDRLQAALRQNRDKYIRLLQELVRIDTSVIGHGIEGGRELKGQQFLAEQIAAMGGTYEFREVNEELIQEGIRRYGEGNPGHNYQDRPNLLGIFPGTGAAGPWCSTAMWIPCPTVNGSCGPSIPSAVPRWRESSRV